MTDLSLLVMALPQMRANAEALMTDSCSITRATEPVSDPDTGVSTSVRQPIWAGKCKLQTSGGLAEETSVSGTQVSVGAQVQQWSLYAHFPMSATGLKPGDLVEITQSSDPELVGKRVRLINLQSEKTHATAHRWNVKEVADDDAGLESA